MWSELVGPRQQGGVALAAALRSARERWLDWRRRRLGLRGTLPYLLAAPLPVAALLALAGADLSGALAVLAAFGLIAGGTRLNRRALLERAINGDRRYTTVRRFPQQYFAAALVSGGTALAAYLLVGHGIGVSLVFGLLALGGFHLSYRLPAPRELFALPRVAVGDPALRRALEQAEHRLLAIEAAALRVGNVELEQRLQRIATKGRTILEMLSQRPTDLFRARQFLHVHLEGAGRVAERYVKAHRFVRGGVLEQRFRKVLLLIEDAFEQQRRRLLKQDLQDLDIQIEVLRRQLQNEGLA
jgi:hypothetical protein